MSPSYCVSPTAVTRKPETRSEGYDAYTMMNFCSQCGHPVTLETPLGDHLPRYVCKACGIVHYQNPKLVVGCVPEHEGRILICKRAIEPRRGYWTIPAGF